MDDFMKQALEIAKAQAGVRPMTPEEFMAYAKDIAEGLMGVAVGQELVSYAEDHPLPAVEANASIKERSVACLVCGKSFKVLGKRHLVLRSRNNSAITISKEQERRDGSTSKKDRIE